MAPAPAGAVLQLFQAGLGGSQQPPGGRADSQSAWSCVLVVRCRITQRKLTGSQQQQYMR